jgi:hypothetical protein
MGDDSDAVKYVKALFQDAFDNDRNSDVVTSCNDLVDPIIFGLSPLYLNVRNRIAIMTDSLAPWSNRGIQRGKIHVTMYGKSYVVDVEMDIDRDVINLKYNRVG